MTTIEKNLMDLARAKNCEIIFKERIYKGKECFAHFCEDPILYIKNKDRTYFLATDTDNALILYNYDTGDVLYPNEVLQLYPTDKKLLELFAYSDYASDLYCSRNGFIVCEVLHDANGNEYYEVDYDFCDYDTVTEVVKAMLKNLF